MVALIHIKDTEDSGILDFELYVFHRTKIYFLFIFNLA